ncbi:transglycosylase family protein [Streptomyces sp. NBC_01089]|uniref:LysM peptidoglycan-binding domain-containing protein n=1 Tax=Streptomyces sp. NBC_01089 TaxID=2903747 RepID=UPI0038681E3A|nr:transglycosylase family protein [Streptomyces sp. NBC_01089]
MRTGNGRHRRPRQAPALVVAAGVTGSAIALPLLASTGAHAADATTWDRVALCESGGIWSADLGNGHYGGLQFSQTTWDKYGGGQYAARPDLASRSQQIAVAQKVYAAEGATPWASCAAIAGLTKGDADTATVDPGSPDTASPTPSASAGSGKDAADPDASADATAGANADDTGQTPSKQSSASPSPSDSPSGSPSSSASPSSPSSPSSGSSSDATGGSDSSPDSGKTGKTGKAGTSGTVDSSASDTPDTPDSGTPAPSDSATSADSGAGKHRGGADDGSGTSRDEAGRHASRGGNPSRDDARTDGSYTVRAGDNLWAIAKAHDLPGGWPALYAANHQTVGDDPDFIVPGQSLDLDPKQG